MCILLLLVVFQAVLVRYSRRFSPVFGFLVFAMTANATIWAGILQIELLYRSGDGTYGSDESLYWSWILSVYHRETQASAHLAWPFVALGASVLSTGATESVFWIRIMNILLYGLAVSLVYLTMRKRQLLAVASGANIALGRHFDIMFLTYFSNPIIIWTVIRGLKETLFLLLIVGGMFCFDLFSSSAPKVNTLTRYLALLASLVPVRLLMPLRAQSYVLLVMGFAVNYLIWQLGSREPGVSGRPRRNRIRVLTVASVVLIGLLVLFLVWTPDLGYITLFRERFAPTDDSITQAIARSSILTFPLSVARFILGPGPPNALRQLLYGDAFEVSAFVGDLLILFGACHWWFTLLLCVLVVALNIRGSSRVLLRNADYLLIAFAFVATYAFIYFGTGDTRHRAVMYFLFGPVIVPLLCLRRSAVPASHESPRREPTVRVNVKEQRSRTEAGWCQRRAPTGTQGRTSFS